MPPQPPRTLALHSDTDPLIVAIAELHPPQQGQTPRLFAALTLIAALAAEIPTAALLPVIPADP